MAICIGVTLGVAFGLQLSRWIDRRRAARAGG